MDRLVPGRPAAGTSAVWVAADRQVAESDPGPGSPAEFSLTGVDHLVGFLLAVAQVPARQAFQRHLGDPLGLKPVEFTLLVLLLVHHGAAPKQLAGWLRVPAPQVTLLVDRLAERGLLQRQRSPHDGRAWQIHLTDAGTALAQQAQQCSQQMEHVFLAPLSPAERAMLRELLLKLVRASDEGAGG